jgi:hypothetical protein
VLLLHGPGPGHDARIWRPLAKRLHKEGYAVLSFDFRGHGDSTTVDADVFWSQAANRAGVRGSGSDEIKVDDFSDRYWPVLINDIAAAKALLDRKNDLGECNSSNLIVIGANAAATLGTVWLNGECFRYRQHPPAFFGALPQLDKAPEVQHVLCAFWINLEPQLGVRNLSLARVLEAPARRFRIPMVFLYDSASALHERTAQALERTLKSPRLPYTGAVEASGGAKRGEELLLQATTQQQLLEHLSSVVEDEADEWQDFDARQAQFLWKLPRRPALVPANRAGSNTLLFQTYESFRAQ